MDGECSPLHGRRLEISVVDVEIASAHRLRSEAVEQRDFGTARNTHCKKKEIVFKDQNFELFYNRFLCVERVLFVVNHHRRFLS